MEKCVEKSPAAKKRDVAGVGRLHAGVGGLLLGHAVPAAVLGPLLDGVEVVEALPLVGLAPVLHVVVQRRERELDLVVRDLQERLDGAAEPLQRARGPPGLPRRLGGRGRRAAAAGGGGGGGGGGAAGGAGRHGGLLGGLGGRF